MPDSGGARRSPSVVVQAETPEPAGGTPTLPETRMAIPWSPVVSERWYKPVILSLSKDLYLSAGGGAAERAPQVSSAATLPLAGTMQLSLDSARSRRVLESAPPPIPPRSDEPTGW